jgi:hypothetical protein
MVRRDVSTKVISTHFGVTRIAVINRVQKIGASYPKTHYQRRGLDNRTPASERFWQYVHPEPNTGCWLWSGSTSTGGYGYILDYEGAAKKAMRAHRWAYEKLRGPIPDGLHLDHLCRVRCCVNPDHLEAVTSGENTRRGNAGAALAEWIKAGNHWRRANGHSPR